MHDKIILAISLGLILIGITQFAFAEVSIEEKSYITINEEEFVQPQSRYDYHEMKIIGHVAEYSRGDDVYIIITEPSGSQEEIQIYATKKGKIYTFLHITNDSQIGIHNVVLKYHGEEIAHTTFEILEKQ